MSKSSASSTKPAWHVNLHAHSLFHLLLLSLSQSDHLLHHHNNQHCFLLTRLSAPPRATAILLPLSSTPLPSLCTNPSHPPRSAWRRCITSRGRPFGGRPLWSFPSRPSKTCRSSSSTSASSSSACCSSTSLSC